MAREKRPYYLAFSVMALDECYQQVSELLHSSFGAEQLSNRHYAHCTVKRGLSLDGSAFQEIVTRLNAGARERTLRPVRAYLGSNFEVFPGSGIIYLPLRGVEPMIRKIVEQFASWGFKPDPLEGKTPHVTFGKVKASQVPKALKLLERVSLPQVDVLDCDTLVMFGRNPDDELGRWMPRTQIFLSEAARTTASVATRA